MSTVQFPKDTLSKWDWERLKAAHDLKGAADVVEFLNGREATLDLLDELEIPEDKTQPRFNIPSEPQSVAVECAPGQWLSAGADLKWRSKRPPREYIIEDLMPSNQVHLLGGPSGAGKTTLAFQMLDALRRGEGNFLGRKILRPMKIAYISADRASNSVEETLDRVQVDFPIFSIVDKALEGKSLIDDVFPMLTATYGYRPDFIYVDGFTGLCPDGTVNNYLAVASWLATLQRYCQAKKITLVGACHTSKIREGEEIRNVRQKVLGTVAWAGYSETIILIEPPENAKVEDSKKAVYLLPRNKPEEKIFVFMEDGKYVLHESMATESTAGDFILETILPEATLTPSRAIDHKSLWAIAERKGVNRRTFDRYLANLVSRGKLRRTGKGVYVVPAEDETI